MRAADLVGPAMGGRLALGHTTGWTGPAFQHDDLVVWGFTAGILAAMFHSAGWDLEWDTDDIRDLEKTLAASGNGEQHRMSAEEARDFGLIDQVVEQRPVSATPDGAAPKPV